jgi:hypothetical protein
MTDESADQDSTTWRRKAADTLASGKEKISELYVQHPKLVTAAVVCTAAVAAPAIVTGAIHVAGFGVAGVVKGSLAASVQSAVYGGATTGAFSALQSAGAVGLSSSASMLTSLVTGGGLWHKLSPGGALEQNPQPRSRL